MPINQDKTRSMITVDDERLSLPASRFLEPGSYTLNADGSISISPLSLVGSFTSSFDIAGTTTPTMTFDYYVLGGIVTIAARGIIGVFTSDSTSFTESVASVPAAIRPLVNAASSQPLSAINDGTTAPAVLVVGTDGIMRFAIYNPTTGTSSANGWSAAASNKAILQKPFVLYSRN